MTGKDRIILQKIAEYASDALEYVRDSQFHSFMEDKKTMSACAFAIGQIGELSKNISQEIQLANPEIP